MHWIASPSALSRESANGFVVVADNKLQVRTHDISCFLRHLFCRRGLLALSLGELFKHRTVLLSLSSSRWRFLSGLQTHNMSNLLSKPMRPIHCSGCTTDTAFVTEENEIYTGGPSDHSFVPIKQSSLIPQDSGVRSYLAWKLRISKNSLHD